MLTVLKGSHYFADAFIGEYTVRRSRPDINELCYYFLVNQCLMLTLVGNGS